MDLWQGVTGEARELVQQHRQILDRLPRTFLANTLVEIQKWPTLFEPEKAYFRTLLEELSALNASEFRQIFGSLQDFESRTGCGRVKGGDPETLETRLLNHLQREGQYSSWRQEIDALFPKIEPRVEARLYSEDRKPRLVVIIYEEGIAIERESLWKRFRAMGTQVPLALGGAQTREPFVRALFTGQPPAEGTGSAPRPAAKPARTLFDVLRESQGFSPLEAWILEAGDALHALCESSAEAGGRTGYVTGLSYERLRAYRERLSEAIYQKVTSGGIRSPLELAAWMKTLEFPPQEGATLYSDALVGAFVRDVFLAGSGTLIINNTFVEWGAVQALKRAQPRLLVARFGVRDKMKPFSSLLLFSKLRPADQIPTLQDPLGSFIDVELLSYYVWLNAEELAPYRGKTLYLLLADGADEMVAVLPGSRKPKIDQPATLMDVAATMARWLDVALPQSPGRALAPLIS